MRLYKKDIEITAGKMKEKLTLLSLTDTPVTGGGINRSYSDGGTFRAFVEPLNESRVLEQSALKWNKAIKILTRDIAQPLPINTSKIRFNNENYTIHSIKNLNNQNRYLEILAWL